MWRRIAGRETTEGRPCGAVGAPVSVGSSDYNVITVAAVRSSAATLTGELAGKPMEMMLDSGSAVSLVLKEEADKLQDK